MKDGFNLYDLFSEAIEKDPIEQERFLKKIKDDDPELYQKIEELITASKRDVIEEMRSTSLKRALLQSQPFHKIKEKMIIDHFVVKKKISVSASTAVFLGLDLNLSREVLLKFHLNESNEPMLVAKINHDAIVQVYFTKHLPDLDCHVTALEWVDGCNLYDFLQKENVTLINQEEKKNYLFNWAITLFEALKEIHSRDILHLDIKPQNILIDSTRNCKITDFNVSISKDGAAQAVIGGTKGYMPPEQARAMKGEQSSLTASADIYSLGSVMLEVMKGFEIENEELAGVFQRCCVEDPRERLSVEKTLEELRNHFQNQHFRENLVASQKDFLLYRLAVKSPAAAIVLSVFVPNFVASVLQILYNQTFIVRHLTQSQIRTFNEVLLPWNSICYTIGILILIRYFMPIFRRNYSFKTYWKRLIRGHIFTLLLTLVLWSFGYCVFTFGFTLTGETLNPDLAIHFFISFLIAMMTQGMFASIILAYVTHIVIAPNALNSKKSAQQMIDVEFAPTKKFFQVARFGLGTVCVLTVILLSWLGRHTDVWQSQATFDSLMIAFCLVALAGFYFGVSLSDRFKLVCSL